MLMPYATAVYAERIIVAAAVILLVHVPDARSIADAHIAHYAQARHHGRAPSLLPLMLRPDLAAAGQGAA
jgi:hypothetical protein